MLREFAKYRKYFRGFRTYYLLVISIILLTITIQSIVQYSLNKQSKTALMVNMAGRQRAMGHKLLAEVYACQQGNCDYAELRLTVNKLVQMDHFLKNGNRELGIQAINDEEILADFEKVNPQVEWFRVQFAELDRVNEVPVLQLSARADIFQSIMDDIVLKLQKKSERDIRTMMIIQIELAFFSVFIVLFEIFFIVNPIIQRLLLQKQKLTEIAWHQSHVFERHFKNISDLEYVLKAEKNEERRQEICVFIREELAHLKKVSETVTEAVSKAREDDSTPYDLAIDKLTEWGRYWLMEKRINPRIFERITRVPAEEKQEQE